MQSLAIPQGPHNPNGYTAEEILAALRGQTGARRFTFRYDLLDASNVKVADLDNVLDGVVEQNWLADIKRKARFVLKSTGTIDFLSQRIKPWVRLWMPASKVPETTVLVGTDATGGTVTEEDGYRYHTFTDSGTLEVRQGGEVEYLIVGGGGGAGGSNNSIRGSGGGGAGRVIQGSGTLAPGSYPVVVGSGGAGGTGLNAGTNGGDSSFNGETAPGGGGGGEADNGSGHDGQPGGSGGGAGSEIGTGGSNVAGSPSAGLGNDGGDAPGAGLGRGGGGGGGAGGVGQPGQSNLGGDGGLGIEWPPGSGDFYAGGGGGGQSGGGSGGSGVGGQGDGSNAVPNTGSGGGGIAGVGATGGDGSDGVVIIRYPIPETVTIPARIKAGSYVEWPQGVFLLATPTRHANRDDVVTRVVDGYDALQVYVDDKVVNRYTVEAGTVYTDVVSDLIGSVPKNVTPSAATLPAGKEWEPGTPKLRIINELLSAINYDSLSFDEHGVAVVRPYVSPADRPAEYVYADDEVSVIHPEVTQELDLFNVANRWVLVVSDPDRPPLVATYTNNDPASPTSTVRRQRTITDFRQEQDAADQVTLEAKVARLAFEASQVYEAVEFTTGLMPIHSGNDCYRISYGPLAVNAKYAEQWWVMPLRAGEPMRHRARRVLVV